MITRRILCKSVFVGIALAFPAYKLAIVDGKTYTDNIYYIVNRGKVPDDEIWAEATYADSISDAIDKGAGPGDTIYMAHNYESTDIIIDTSVDPNNTPILINITKG